MPSVVINTDTDGAVIIPAPSSPTQQIQLVGWDVSAEDTTVVGFVSSVTDTLLWMTQATTVPGGGVMRPASQEWDIFAPAGEGVAVSLTPGGVMVSGAITYAIRGV